MLIWGFCIDIPANSLIRFCLIWLYVLLIEPYLQTFSIFFSLSVSLAWLGIRKIMKLVKNSFFSGEVLVSLWSDFVYTSSMASLEPLRPYLTLNQNSDVLFIIRWLCNIERGIRFLMWSKPIQPDGSFSFVTETSFYKRWVSKKLPTGWTPSWVKRLKITKSTYLFFSIGLTNSCKKDTLEPIHSIKI